MNGYNNGIYNKRFKMVSTWIIALCFSLSFMVFPFFIGLVLLIIQTMQIRKQKNVLNNAEMYAQSIVFEAESKKKAIYAETEEILKKVNSESFLKMQEDYSKTEKQIEAYEKKLAKITWTYRYIKSYFEKYDIRNPDSDEIRKIENYMAEIDCSDMLNPTVEIILHNSNVKDLRKKYKEIDKEIGSKLNEYEKRYTTKSNLAIYRLMVVALRSELQNVLYTLKFQRLDASLNQVKDIADKYLKIAGEGNQSIAPTMAKFISEMESLFTDAVKVEYEYYVRKEQAKEQQKALREQMKQEAEERKALEAQRKQVEKEESKYLSEIEKLKAQLAEADREKTELLSNRIAEVQELLSAVEGKKEEIAKLQNGKAGYVYIISNLGSFGDKVFKIGMTRRLEPQERIDELGSASVPFKFDVHSFIFSEDAPALESNLHRILNEKRTNKINLRKEFFTVTLDELEELVYKLEPTAEFNRTMVAEEYYQSLSFNNVIGEISDEYDDEDDDETAELQVV